MIRIWCTYHDPSLIEEYDLENKGVYLFYSKDDTLPMKNINDLQEYWCELVTMWYIWQNQIKSDIVGFCHYRRFFDKIYEDEINEGCCQVYEKVDLPLYIQYKNAHKIEDLDTVIECIDRLYGKGNVYKDYLHHTQSFYNRNMFVMKWMDFNRLCTFVFGVLEEYLNIIGIEFDPKKYEEYCKKEGKVGYDKRWIGFLGERLVSAFIGTYFKENQILM